MVRKLGVHFLPSLALSFPQAQCLQSKFSKEIFKGRLLNTLFFSRKVIKTNNKQIKGVEIKFIFLSQTHHPLGIHSFHFEATLV